VVWENTNQCRNRAPPPNAQVCRDRGRNASNTLQSRTDLEGKFIPKDGSAPSQIKRTKMSLLNDSEELVADTDTELLLTTGVQVQPVYLSWKNVSYAPKGYAKIRVPNDDHKDVELKVEDGELESLRSVNIIREISGCAVPGRLLVILGPSGSGKTTLMDLLCSRKSSGDIGGEILANGKPMNRHRMKRVAAYVLQDDVMMGALSVAETLTFAARLKLPEETPKPEIEARVQRVMNELGLSHIADSKIGTMFLRGISGGEKKRVAIGQELITDPSVLFLDEPTSGLDSSNAFNVVYSLKKLASAGRTIICTIHQPSRDLFDLFDDLLVLTNEGDLGYFGPASEAVSFFEIQCGTIPAGLANPAEYLLKVVSGSRSEDNTVAFREEHKKSISVVYQIHMTPEQVRANSQKFKESGIFEKHMDYHLNEFNQAHKSEIEAQETDLKGGFATSTWRQFSAVAWRSFLCIIRDPMQTYVLTILNIFFGALIGSIYWQVPNTQSGIQDRAGSLFFLAMNGAFSNMSLQKCKRTCAVSEQI
jgi:ATP-binding cassette subfamily G (WHITE) protein 2